MLQGLLAAYRATGADLPFGQPLRPHHGVGMEGYFWRLTDQRQHRVLIALIGVNRGPNGPWATIGLAGSNGFVRTVAEPGAYADPTAGAGSGGLFAGTGDRVRVDLGPDARLDVRLEDAVGWPHRLFGGSSGFQLVPALNQYWHPWLLGGRASGTAVLGDQQWRLDGAAVYAEKNWGREGFPESWWWGQSQGFADPQACLAFAGGRIRSGPLTTTVTALVVRLPDGRVLRLGNPGTSPVRARVGHGSWQLRGHAPLRGWQVEVEGQAPLDGAHVLPVPLPSQERNIPGDVEHLTGRVQVTVRRRGRTVWTGESTLAALEEGGLALAADQLRRRGAPAGATCAGPLR